MSETAERPFYRHLGIEVVESGNGRALLRMNASSELLNRRGDVHGGAIAGLMDATLSNAARASLGPGMGVATIQFASHFLIPGRGELHAEGKALRAGSSVVTAEARVTDSEGRLVASALGTMKVLAPRR